MVFTRKSQVYYKLTEKRPIDILKQFEKKTSSYFLYLGNKKFQQRSGREPK